MTGLRKRDVETLLAQYDTDPIGALTDALRRVLWKPPMPLTAESLDAALEAELVRPWQRELLYAGRAPAAAPATGISKIHDAELRQSFLARVADNARTLRLAEERDETSLRQARDEAAEAFAASSGASWGLLALALGAGLCHWRASLMRRSTAAAVPLSSCSSMP